MCVSCTAGDWLREGASYVSYYLAGKRGCRVCRGKSEGFVHELILRVHQLSAFLGYGMLMKGNDGVLAITLCGTCAFRAR